LYWLSRIKELKPDINVIMLTAHGDVELAVKAVKISAFDFILKPWSNDKLIETISDTLEFKKKKKNNSSVQSKTNLVNETEMIGESTAMQKVFKMIKKVAVTDANIFVSGENGTGKELIAREIHRLSERNQQKLVSVDMGAVSETLFESELFGHMKGSFTDAKDDRPGKFEIAHEGSLFLDEIGNLSMGFQAKILTALQNRKITRLGSNEPIDIDLRLISATNKDLDTMVAEGTFRQDLLYRINTICIEIPPLRERGEDVLLLADFYLKQYSDKYGKTGLKINQDGKNLLMRYSWPGNVRELQHSIEKAVILCDGIIIADSDFNLRKELPVNKFRNLQTLEDMEKQMIQDNIYKENGNMSTVAKNLGITRQTLYNKLKKYEISI